MVVVISILSGGCWNYRGIDQMETVIGVAFDKGSKEDSYLLTFENADSAKVRGTDGNISPKLIESEGPTVFDAVRQAKRRLANKLYFAQMKVLIISEQIAREQGIQPIIDWFMHDQETREVIHLLIAQGDSAKKLFEAKPISADFVSQEICDIIEEDNDVTSYTFARTIYKTFDILNKEGVELALPVFTTVQNGQETAVISNGGGVFKKDKLIGLISYEEAHYSLFVIDEVNGGVLTADLNNDGGNNRDDIALEILKCDTKRSFSFDGERIKVKIHVKIKAASTEVPKYVNLNQKESIVKLQKAAESRLEQNIKQTVKAIQSKGLDIFGFGSMVYQKDKRLWEKLGKDWADYFKNAEVEVSSKISIINSGLSR